MKSSLSLFIAIIFIGILSCAKVEDYEFFDSSKQYTEDSTKMIDYLESAGIDTFERNDADVLVIVLDSGEAEKPEVSDIVKVNYVGYLLDSTIFESTLPIVWGDSVDLYDEDHEYSPTVYNYTTDGWTLGGYITGFRTGLSSLTGYLGKNGHGLVIMPSRTAYGTGSPSDLIPENSVLLFEFRLVSITKQ